ncbi:helix-turn-helix domain-containing protein [Natrinema soli]|uniref:Winged helix-turn-helix domain-containing protein n=1 Tax=Natrinema soli TaxID=1930624 RepID=A0ABD5SMU6_9EURY|nr:helix-turn-helix domain-containing protein [Natrinema soli]
MATEEIEINSKADFLRVSLYWVVGESEWNGREERDRSTDEKRNDPTIEWDKFEKQNSPTYIRTLYASKARQDLADFFLDLRWSEEYQPLSKQNIIDHTGLQRKTVIEHIDVLVDMGIVNEVKEGRWPKYEPAVDKETYQIVLEANQVLGEYYS